MAQDFEGKIVYKINYLEVPAEMRGMESMLPQELEMLIKGSKMAMKQNLMGGTQTVLFDGETEASAVVMDMMGQKMAIMVSPEDEQKAREELGKPSFEYSNEAKDIAGFKCSKVIMKVGDQELEMWYTKEIKGAIHKDYKELDGFPLEYLTVTQGMKLQMIATTVSRQSQDDSNFEVPDGYTKMSMAEFTKKMGGGR
jgi:hypothetical protein